MAALPDELWHRILERLTFRDQVQCERVCKQFYQLLCKPGLWSGMKVNLDQMVNPECAGFEEPVSVLTPASKWILKRVARPPHRIETCMCLTGKASHLIESLTLPYLFGAMHALDAEFFLALELFDYPHPAHDEDSHMGISLGVHTQREYARMWQGRLMMLTLHLTRDIRLSMERDFWILPGLCGLRNLVITGDNPPPTDSSEDATGITGPLDFVFGLTSLDYLVISGQTGLNSISKLECLDQLEHLEINCSKVDAWPECLSNLEALTTLKLTQQQPVVHTISGLAAARQLLLPDTFNELVWLNDLALTHQVVKLCDEAFAGLACLRCLDLTGSDLVSPSWGNDAGPAWTEQGLKPLEGLTSLTELNLSLHAPTCGGWNGMGDALSELGVTALTRLRKLSLQHNFIRSVPASLRHLTGLVQLDLSHNWLEPAEACNPAILHLHHLTHLNVGNPIRLGLTSQRCTHCRAAMAERHRGRQSRSQRPVCLAVELPDISKLLGSCPALRELHTCNAA